MEDGSDDLFTTILYRVVKVGLIVCVLIVIAVFVLLMTNRKE